MSTKPISIERDDASDLVKIEGVCYSQEIFRTLGIAPPNTLLRIVSRSGDGTLNVRSYAPGEQVTA